jgi:adenylylsulfate kinase
MHETKRRSLLKGLTWRVTASITTMLIVFIITGNLALVAGVGLADVTLKVFFYYLHERLWGRVHWGVLGVEPSIK